MSMKKHIKLIENANNNQIFENANNISWKQIGKKYVLDDDQDSIMLVNGNTDDELIEVPISKFRQVYGDLSSMPNLHKSIVLYLQYKSSLDVISMKNHSMPYKDAKNQLELRKLKDVVKLVEKDNIENVYASVSYDTLKNIFDGEIPAKFGKNELFIVVYTIAKEVA